MEMDAKIVLMTPQWAADILASQNTNNRPIKKLAVQKLITAIERGEWVLTHQGIAIDWDGRLIDGQHRLLAIQLSGITVPIYMTINCDPATFVVCDIGTARTSGDVLTVHGVAQYNATMIGAATGIVLRYSRYPNLIWIGKNAIISHADILDYYKYWDEWDLAIKCAGKAYRGYKQITPSNIMALIILARNTGHPWKIIENFSQGIGTGANLPGDSVLLAYRNYLQYSGSRPTKNTSLQQHRLACIIKCYNYYIQSVPTRLFKAPKYPPMPEIRNL